MRDNHTPSGAIAGRQVLLEKRGVTADAVVMLWDLR